MNDELLKAVIEMVRQGGTAAMWIYVAYLLGGVLKFAIGFGCILLGIYRACKTALIIAEKDNAKTT